VEIIEAKHILSQGSAARLFDYFVSNQTGADGLVKHGRGFTYRELADDLGVDEFGLPIPERTLRRWVARLREDAYIRTQTLTGYGGLGIRVWILRQKKFIEPAAEQLDLSFPMQVVGGTAVEAVPERPNSAVGSGHPVVLDRPKMAGGSGQKWPRNTLYKTTSTSNTHLASENFEIFFAAYPNKIQRQTALAAWRLLELDHRLGEVLASIDVWKASGRWDVERYIPYGKTFLETGLWKESVPPRKEITRNGNVTPEQHEEIFKRNVEAFLKRNHR
jgi:hypothetical protein